MKSFLAKILKKISSYLGESFHNSVKWLNDELFLWLPKVLKGMGFAGLSALVINTFYQSYNTGVERFGLFARIFQIDDIFDSINDVFSPYLTSYISTDFIGVCNAFGIISAINEILNAVGWSLMVYLFIFVARIVFSSMSALLLFIPKI